MNVGQEASSTNGLALEVLDDSALLALVRGGQTAAFGVLYDRYVYSARRLARHLGQREESDDVVSESFAQIFDLLKRAKGPERAFRAYLFTTIRHECGRRAKAGKRVVPTDDDAQIDTAVPFGDGQLDDFEKTAIRAAYESLPTRWRAVLWHLDVEGAKPSDLAQLFDLKPNTVSALAYRARSALRDAYLQQHVAPADDSLSRLCSETRALLAGVVRRTASTREQQKVHAHLDVCAACMGVYLDVEIVGRDVGALVLPAAVVGLACGTATAPVLVLIKGLASAAAAVAAIVASAVAVVSVSSPVPASAAVDGPLASMPIEQMAAVAPSSPAVAQRLVAPAATRPTPAPAPTAIPTAAPPDPVPSPAAGSPKRLKDKVAPLVAKVLPGTSRIPEVLDDVVDDVTGLLAMR